MKKWLVVLGCVMVMNVISAEWNEKNAYWGMLRNSVPVILKSYHPETGRFGNEPWTCQDQHNMFPLAVAWWYEDKNNPYYHSDELLKIIIKSGDALIDDMDENGMWIFRKKDNSTWGMIHMPWTYSRWIRTYLIVRDAFPPEVQERWDRALQLGYSKIEKYCEVKVVHNIALHHAMGLYAAGKLFDRKDWMKTASEAVARAVADQDPQGFWQEHIGPVVNYNFVYIDALGCYYAMSRDESVLPALERAARYHASILFRDGTSAACLDERNAYSWSKPIGSPGFAWTAVGRGFLKQQFMLYRAAKQTFGPDHTAMMLYHGTSGDAIMPTELGENGTYFSTNQKLAKVSRGLWELFMTAYTCPALPKNRWMMERHNMLDVFLDGRGVIAGGGNSRLQPLFSTFTFGDPGLLVMDYTVENPNFLPKIALQWIPEDATLHQEGNGLLLNLSYGENRTSVKAEFREENRQLALTYRLEGTADAPCEAHLPLLHQNTFLSRSGYLQLGDGTRVALGEKLEVTAEQAKGYFVYNGVRYEMPAKSVLRWPVRIFNQYAKFGESKLQDARLVLCIPLGTEAASVTVLISEEPSFAVRDALCFMAADLPASGTPGTSVKNIQIFGETLRFMGTSRNGASMTLTLEVPETGEYEMIVEYLMAYSYGISQLSLDGKPIGKPYNGYAEEVDLDQPLSYGRHQLTKGSHTLTLTTVKRDPRGKANSQSIRAIYLKK